MSNTKKVKETPEADSKATEVKETPEAESKATEVKEVPEAESDKKAAKKKTKKASVKKQKVTVLASNLAGKYKLPYNPGQVIELEAKQAKEMIDAGDAKEA